MFAEQISYIFAEGIDHQIGSQLPCQLKPAFIRLKHDDPAGTGQLGELQHDHADGSAADDHHGIAGFYAA